MEPELLATCYLHKDGDELNKCLLTKETLTIIKGGKKSIFFNGWIRSLTFKRKKFLIPIVFGGITASLASLGLFQYYLNPWVMLGILFGAVLLIYFGAVGGLALIVETPIKEYDFFVKEATPNMRSFIGYAHNALRGEPMVFYFKRTKDEMNLAKQLGQVTCPKEGLKLSHSSSGFSSDHFILSLSSEDLSVEIKYIEMDGLLTPFVFGNIPLKLVKTHRVPDSLD